MSLTCTCNVTLSNTGLPGCQPLMDVGRRLIIVPLRDSSNALNRIDASSIPSASAITALINQSDDLARWYPLPDMENVVSERGDSILESFPSGTNAKVRDGISTFTAEFIEENASPQFLAKLKGLGCARAGVYVVDNSGNLIGDGGVSGYLAPIPIDGATWDPVYVPTTDTTVPKIRLSFQFNKSFNDADLRMLVSGDFDSSTDLLDLNGLIDLYGGTPSGISTTGFTIPVRTGYGSIANPVVQSNLASSDFEIYNETTNSTVTISTMTESPSGTYAFTFSAQSSNDVLHLRIASGTDGFDDTNLESVDITIP
jgi:hypothetical protein